MRRTDSTGNPKEAAHEPGGHCMILGYDRSESARHAATWVTNELMRDGKLVIVYACRPLHTLPAPLSTHERHNLGRALLDELVLDGDDELFDIDFAMEVSDEDPVTALIDAARHHEAHAIVIGAKHHSRLYEALGSVTSELLKTSPVPVITIPSSASPVSGQAFTQFAAPQDELPSRIRRASREDHAYVRGHPDAQ